MSGTVGIIANDNARYTLFAVALTQLQAPPNTAIDWSVTSDRIYGRNKLTERALERGAEWLLFIDDDHVFPNNIVKRLLAHDVGIVGSLYLQRMMPFKPVCYTSVTSEGTFGSIDLTKHGEDDLVEVVAVGTGGMLIRSEVFHKMDFPWFEHGVASEDLIFCLKARDLGFPIYTDLGCRMGHMLPSAVWPSFDEGWNVGFTVADNFRINVTIDNEAEPVAV